MILLAETFSVSLYIFLTLVILYFFFTSWNVDRTGYENDQAEKFRFFYE